MKLLYTSPFKLDQLMSKQPSGAALFIATEDACSDKDVLTVFRRFTLRDLYRLDAGLRAGRVISASYAERGGRGCILNRLRPSIKSFESHVAYFKDDAGGYAASNRLVDAWDSGVLTAARVQALLARAIAEREEVNGAEDRAVRRVRRALTRQLAARLMSAAGSAALR